MAGNLSSAMLTELRSPGKTVIPILRLFLTAGTRNYSSVDAASVTLGRIVGKVMPGGWGPIQRSVSDRDNNLSLNSCTVQIEDTDRTFSSLLEDSNANTLRGTRALIQLASPNVTPANWATLFDGYLESWAMASQFVWTLTIHPNDQPLLGVFPKTGVLASDFPNVGDKTVYGEFVPVLWGVHDSRGSSDGGMVPCPYVDRINFRYLVSHGWTTVDRVYKNGAGISASDYAVTHPTINGRLYTLITIDAPGYTADDVVTADVTGYESVGDGSGTTLTGVDALIHALDNFVFGDYQGGNWVAAGTNAPIATSLMTTCQSFLTDMGWEKVSHRYGGENQTTGMQLVADFCTALQLYAFFTRDGLLAAAADDHRSTTLWYDAPRWLRYDTIEVGDSFKLDYDRMSITDRINIQYVYDSAGGKYVQNSEVRDLSIAENNATDLQLSWSHASLDP